MTYLELMNRLFLLASICLALQAQTREKRIVPVDPGQRNVFQRQGKVAVLVGVGDYPAHQRAFDAAVSGVGCDICRGGA
jgi:hypothetical protein